MENMEKKLQNAESVIDWDLALKLAGNKRELAEDLLNMLTMTLKKDVQKILFAYNNKNFDELQQRIHKLHGAVSYCGAPRLKKIISLIEIALKQNNVDSFSTLLHQFELEANLLIEAIQIQ